MNAFFWISYTILWLLVVPLVLLNLVLFRQLGIMVMGTARGVNQSGIPVGRKLPKAETSTLYGKPWTTEALYGNSAIMLFASPTCKECARILPEFGAVAKQYGVKPILLLFATAAQGEAYMQAMEYDEEVLLVTPELAERLDVEVTPFAYAVDPGGMIRHKGLVNSREQLEAYVRAARAS